MEINTIQTSEVNFAYFTSFALCSTLLIYASLHVLLDADAVADTYPPISSSALNEENDIEPFSFKNVLYSMFAYMSQLCWHLWFLLKISLRIAGTLVLLVISAMILMAISNRLLVDVATQRGEQKSFSYHHDPSIRMTTVIVIAKQGLGMLIALLLCHAVVAISSIVLMRPDNMRNTEKEIAPKIRMYLSVLFIVTLIVVVSEAIRISRHE